MTFVFCRSHTLIHSLGHLFQRLAAQARTVTVMLMLGLLGRDVVAAERPARDLFAMDNGVGRGGWTPEQQATTLRELGYQGISYNYTRRADLEAWLVALDHAKLRLFGLYVPAQLSAEQLFPAEFEAAVPLLRNSGAVIWLILPSPTRASPDDESRAVRAVQAAADLAASAGLRVVLYPHKGFYVATAEQALALTLRAGRANVGLTVNLAHELAAGNGPRLPDIIRKVAPCLERVTLNGASDTPGPGWDNYIQLLGHGSYDVAALVRTLDEVNYTGPVGLQFYNVKGDSRANLAESMTAWRALSRTPAP